MNSVAKISCALVGVVLAAGVCAETPVEVTLMDRLDEPRGFCLDTLGFQTRARPEEGLQTHSCYSYQGQLAVDQAFDADGLSQGMFRIIDFNLCMTARELAAGTGFALEPCEGRETQQFEHRSDGKIASLSIANYCVTAGAGPSRHGGGGEPVHLIRDLTLERCNDSQNARQQWRLRDSAD